MGADISERFAADPTPCPKTHLEPGTFKTGLGPRTASSSLALRALNSPTRAGDCCSKPALRIGRLSIVFFVRAATCSGRSRNASSPACFSKGSSITNLTHPAMRTHENQSYFVGHLGVRGACDAPGAPCAPCAPGGCVLLPESATSHPSASGTSQEYMKGAFCPRVSCPTFFPIAPPKIPGSDSTLTGGKDDPAATLTVSGPLDHAQPTNKGNPDLPDLRCAVAGRAKLSWTTY